MKIKLNARRSFWLLGLIIVSVGCIKKPLPLMDQPIASGRETILTDTPTPTFTSSPTNTQTNTPTITHTATITETLPPTSRFKNTRAEVQPERLTCRYGPGVSYLYKFGLVGGSVLEVIGKSPYNNWVLLRAIGGNNPCWASGSNLTYDSDLTYVPYADYHTTFPTSPYPYYWSPLENVTGIRDGDSVQISWDRLVLFPGDEHGQSLYLVEVWVCQDGNYVFFPIGSMITFITVTDQKGCDEPSKAKVYGVEKHGYTPVFEFKLPLHEGVATFPPSNTQTPTPANIPTETSTSISPSTTSTSTSTPSNTPTPTFTPTPINTSGS
jgi:hypothetical protein